MVTKENDLLSDYLQSLYGIELLPVEEEHRLAKLIAQGDDDALDKLVTHNLRFVVYIVRQMTAWQHGKTTVEDIVAMGNEALFKAARRWKPTNNARFATYAKSFILKDVRRDIDNTTNLIRLPVNVIEQIKKLSYNTRILSQVLGREPAVNELAEVMGLSEGKIHLLQTHMNKEPISISNLKQEKHIEESNDD
jgi:DNA-directed RNA polymerase sigma subunit (sigma70/sigma32)